MLLCYPAAAARHGVSDSAAIASRHAVALIIIYTMPAFDATFRLLLHFSKYFLHLYAAAQAYAFIYNLIKILYFNISTISLHLYFY